MGTGRDLAHHPFARHGWPCQAHCDAQTRIDGGAKVRFRWNDYRDGTRQKTAAIEADEFNHRFLIHVLPAAAVILVF